jgi:hypothetical protein
MAALRCSLRTGACHLSPPAMPQRPFADGALQQADDVPDARAGGTAKAARRAESVADAAAGAGQIGADLLFARGDQSSMLRSIQAVFSWICMRWVSKSAVGSS